MQIEFLPTTCPLCGPGIPAHEIYPSALTSEAFTSAVFSARRNPDGLHYRIVRCDGCGLLRSDPTAPAAIVDTLYRHSSFAYALEEPNLRRTYGRYLDRALNLGVRRNAFLEIGCGDGFFLEEAKRRGFSTVRGIEPSMEACATSNGTEIVQEPLRSGLFGPATFDVICAFQVLDHLADPVAALRICRDLLSPGGVLLLVHHDAKALSARVMGRRSPIVDVQHTFLYTKDTTRKLLEKSGFEPVHVGRAVNIASLRHLAHLAPVGRTLKNAALKMLSSLRLENVSLPLPLGNLVAIARRPVA